MDHMFVSDLSFSFHWWFHFLLGLLDSYRWVIASYLCHYSFGPWLGSLSCKCQQYRRLEAITQGWAKTCTFQRSLDRFRLSRGIVCFGSRHCSSLGSTVGSYFFDFMTYEDPKRRCYSSCFDYHCMLSWCGQIVLSHFSYHLILKFGLVEWSYKDQCNFPCFVLE